MIGTGLIGALITIIVVAAILWLLYYLVSPAPFPPNLKMAVYILIFIILLIWFAKIVVPALGLAL